MAKKKATKKRRVNSKDKGDRFERRIARDMREIFDTAELNAALTTPKLKPSDRAVLLKRSRVRKGRQKEGAVEPDVVIEGADLWLEMQHASGGDYTPLKKLQQAERDIEQCKSDKKPIAVTLKTGHRTIEATLRLKTLLALVGCDVATAIDDEPIRITYDLLNSILRKREARSPVPRSA